MKSELHETRATLVVLDPYAGDVSELLEEGMQLRLCKVSGEVLDIQVCEVIHDVLAFVLLGMNQNLQGLVFKLSSV